MSLVNAEKTEKNLYTLEFSVDKATFENAVNNAYRKQVRKINIPGFRPGKAPRHIIEKMYGKGFFYEDAFNEVLPDAYAEAVKEAAIEAVGQPDIDVKSVDDGVVFTAKVYVKPEVKIDGYKGIEVEKHINEVTDAEVDAEINTLRERNAREINVTDKPAEMGDVATIDYEGFCDGVAFDGGKGENHPLELGSGAFIPGFEEQVVGHSVGDEFDVNVTFPTEYHAADLAGKQATFKCKLHAITKKELPALDDEFAKDISEFDTFDEYRNDVKAKIQKRHDAQADAAVENDLAIALMDKLEADIPEVMFENETENFVRDYDNRLRMQGLNLDMYFKYTQQTLDDLRKQMRPQAESQVKTRLALEKIVELEGIKATDEDVNAEYQRLADAYNMEIDKVKELIKAEDIAKDMAVQKAMEFVKENAVIKECHDDHDHNGDSEEKASEKPAKKPAARKKKSAPKTDTPAEPADTADSAEATNATGAED